jgi:hypothetical protein
MQPREKFLRVTVSPSSEVDVKQGPCLRSARSKTAALTGAADARDPAADRVLHVLRYLLADRSDCAERYSRPGEIAAGNAFE